MRTRLEEMRRRLEERRMAILRQAASLKRPRLQESARRRGGLRARRRFSWGLLAMSSSRRFEVVMILFCEACH